MDKELASQEILELREELRRTTDAWASAADERDRNKSALEEEMKVSQARKTMADNWAARAQAAEAKLDGIRTLFRADVRWSIQNAMGQRFLADLDSFLQPVQEAPPFDEDTCSVCGWSGSAESAEGFAAWSRSMHTSSDGKPICSHCPR